MNLFEIGFTVVLATFLLSIMLGIGFITLDCIKNK